MRPLTQPTKSNKLNLRPFAVYSTPITPSGGNPTYTLSLFSGALPAGMTFDTAYWLLKGKITASPGVFNFAIKAVDNEGRSFIQSYALYVDPLLSQTTTRLNDAIVGSAHSPTMTAIGGLVPYTWKVYADNLPAGLMLDPATGIIAGTPTLETSEPVTIVVTGSDGRSAYYAYTLRYLNPLQIPTTSLPNGFLNAPYSELVRVTGGIAPYSYSTVDTLPAGLTLNNATGIISGTPAVVRLTNVAITVNDSTWSNLQTQNVNIGIRISSQLTITTTSIFPNARIGVTINPVALAARGGTILPTSVLC